MGLFIQISIHTVLCRVTWRTSIMRRTIVDRSVHTQLYNQVTLQRTVCIEICMKSSVKRVTLGRTEGGRVNGEGRLVVGIGARKERERESEPRTDGGGQAKRERDGKER